LLIIYLIFVICSA